MKPILPAVIGAVWAASPQNAKIKGEIPYWRFTCAADQTWSWRHGDIVSDPLPTLAAAIAEVKAWGSFDAVREYWTVTNDVLTMHHRPGKASVVTPAGEEPKDWFCSFSDLASREKSRLLGGLTTRDTRRMPADTLPDNVLVWRFTHTVKRGTWSWLMVDRHGKAAKAAGFLTLAAATAEAAHHGFDPFSHYWTTTIGGRTTHYRPGPTPVNLRAGQTLLD